MTRPLRPRNIARICLRRFPQTTAAMAKCGYSASGRTLITLYVQDALDRAHVQRCIRAEGAHAQAEADLDEAVCALLSAPGAPRWDAAIGLTLDSVDAHERACGRRLIRAEAELAAAKRSASRPVGDLVTPPLVSLPQPRTWPNAAPGGTSPRRARIAVRRANFAHARALCAEARRECAAIYGVRSGKTTAGVAAFVRSRARPPLPVLSEGFDGQAEVIGQMFRA